MYLCNYLKSNMKKITLKTAPAPIEIQATIRKIYTIP
ncbi:hypothetical protein F-E9_115 [Faustovirus]|nr:hypothetical protein F-E9_115 [Faustovirus]